MSQFSPEFSERLIAAAQSLESDGLEIDGSPRAVLYLASLAAEIALKVLLEEAGIPVKKIRKHGHNLSKLLGALSECTVLADIGAGWNRRVPATRVRAINVDPNNANATIGLILSGEERGASNNVELRYDEDFSDYHPGLKLRAAEKLLEWVLENRCTVEHYSARHLPWWCSCRDLRNAVLFTDTFLIAGLAEQYY